MTYEGLRLKVLKFWRLGLANHRKKQLKSTDFTIISNNCWGGMIYESYNLPKESPTVGMFFIAKDYIEFLSDLKGYVNGKLTFIKPEESRWKDMPQVSGDKRFGSYPVGVLSNGKNSIEIFFLHYHSEQEAREKWERRVQRINWNKLLVKFNDQDGKICLRYPKIKDSGLIRSECCLMELIRLRFSSCIIIASRKREKNGKGAIKSRTFLPYIHSDH